MDGQRMINIRRDIITILSRIAFGSVVVIPMSLSNYSLSHQEGLSIKYSKTSPPLAIFEDEKITLLTEDEVGIEIKKEPLVSNRLQIRKIANKVARRFDHLQKESLKTAPQFQVRHLSGIYIKKNSPAVTTIISTPENTVTLAKTTVRAPTKVEIPIQRSDPSLQIEAQKFIADLNPKLRSRVQALKNFDEILAEDYTSESFEDRAKVIIAANAPTALMGASDRAKDITHNIRSVEPSGRRSYSERMERAAKRRDDISRRFARSGYFRPDQEMRGLVPDPSELDIADKSQPKTFEEDRDKVSEKGGVAVAARELGKQVVISGTLEMTKGLALTDNREIIVYRQIGGTKLGYGQVLLQEGRYEILVEDPRSGIVAAELLEDGVMLGRAEILMPEVLQNLKSPEGLKEIPIKLEPVLDQVIAENVSAYSYYSKQKIKNSKVRINDMLDANTRIFNSTIIVKTEKEDHWGNISMGSSKQIFMNILNPDATIKALSDILGIKKLKEQMGIIKGEVSIAGHPVEGAQIEVLTANDLLKPVYFNSFIPDPNLKETTGNGQYALVGLNPGSYLVRAKYKGKYLSPQAALVDAGYVTQVNFDVQKPSLSEAFIFDIQTSELLSGSINFVGSEHRVSAQARKLISFSGNNGVQFLEVQADDPSYYLTRVTVDKSEKEILIPMISQDWLNALLSRLKVNSIPETGLIIGTARELSYSVELDPNAYNEETRIVYFDHRGQLIAGGTYVPAGGGFVAINVNPGIRSLFNRYQGTKHVKITTMIVDDSAINVLNSKF